LVVEFDVDLNIGVGEYTLTVAVHRDATHAVTNYDWWDKVIALQIVPRHRAVPWAPRGARPAACRAPPCAAPPMRERSARRGSWTETGASHPSKVYGPRRPRSCSVVGPMVARREVTRAQQHGHPAFN
jgi:hypothetical protein